MEIPIVKCKALKSPQRDSMIESAREFRWNLIVQDENGRQTQPESLLTRWFKKENIIYFYSKPGFCEHELALNEETRLERHGYDGIKITSGLTSAIISNIGDHASSGLLNDLLTCLLKTISIDSKSGLSDSNTADHLMAPDDQVARFLESFLNKSL